MLEGTAPAASAALVWMRTASTRHVNGRAPSVKRAWKWEGKGQERGGLGEVVAVTVCE